MKMQFRVLLLLSVIAVVGCQKSGTSSDGEVQSIDQALSQKNCQDGPSQDVSIIGLESLKSGQKAHLSLSSGVNCNDAEGALWKVGNTLVGSGQNIETEIKGSGNYILSVEIPNKASQGAAQNKTAGSSVLSVQARITVTDSGVVIAGPQAGTADMSYNFSLVAPSGVQITGASWDFGDGSAAQNSSSDVSHTFPEGVYQVKVALTLADGKVENLQHQITLLPVPDGRYCALDQLQIVGPTEVPISRGMDFSVNLSACLQSVVTGISWDLGDQSPAVSGASARHAFDQVGVFVVTAEVSLNGTSISLIREVKVIENLETMPGPTPAPNPNRCVGFGTTRTIDGNTFTEVRACGVEGTQELTLKTVISQRCDEVGDGLEWVEVSRENAIVSEGACQAQSCSLVTENGSEILKHGQSRTLYSSKTPLNSCQEVQSVRTCTNGVLSGSDAAQFLTCNSGCGEFGIHGTVQVGVLTGEIQGAMVCPKDQSEVVAIYHQLSDRTCANGSIVNSNVRQGDLKTPGVCATYGWEQSGKWTTCSADCGGEQSMIWECRRNDGQVVSESLCSDSAVRTVTQVCDGNPQAVAKTETSVVREEAPSCATCPKNQIGVIVKERDVTTVKVQACIDHKVKLTSTVTNGAWVEESYCRDLTPSRCSQDSLSNNEAHGRYDWLVKCQTNPIIKEFLDQFEAVKYKGYGLDTPGRVLYPTFMSTETKKVWVAPKKATASCDIPASVYIAGVCVSSCATPEQQILVERDKKLKYMSFVDALTQKVGNVATLQSNSTMASKSLAHTKVDVWVTEMVDSDHDILVFNMKSGGQLKLTTNHPILTADGVMKLSADFKSGESLVQVGGILDPIVSIEKAVHHGKVYNVFVKSSDLRKNVVVTNGYLNGTAFYQNEGAKFMNRAMFRQQMFKGAFPEGK